MIWSHCTSKTERTMSRLIAIVWATKVFSTPALAKFSLHPSVVQKQVFRERSETHPSYGLVGEQTRPAYVSLAEWKDKFFISSFYLNQIFLLFTWRTNNAACFCCGVVTVGQSGFDEIIEIRILRPRSSRHRVDSEGGLPAFQSWDLNIGLFNNAWYLNPEMVIDDAKWIPKMVPGKTAKINKLRSFSPCGTMFVDLFPWFNCSGSRTFQHNLNDSFIVKQQKKFELFINRPYTFASYYNVHYKSSEYLILLVMRLVF